MHDEQNEVVGGVDTHALVHVAAVVNAIGKILATASFAVTAAGYAELLAWMRSFGTLKAVGVEGTGSYGAGLCRFLIVNDVTVIEVNRANRQLRRRRGKSDSTDAESAARAVLNGEANGVPKTSDGNVERYGRCVSLGVQR
jgi:transposase